MLFLLQENRQISSIRLKRQSRKLLATGDAFNALRLFTITQETSQTGGEANNSTTSQWLSLTRRLAINVAKLKSLAGGSFANKVNLVFIAKSCLLPLYK